MIGKRGSFEEISVKIFQVLGILLFVVLSYYSIGMTAENKNLYDEHVFETPDSLIENIFWICMALLFFFAVQQIIRRYAQNVNMQFVAAIVSITAALGCIYWIGTSHIVPQSDQMNICVCAEAFNSGDYTYLERGQYVGICRQQLGLITLIRVLFYLFGTGNYRAFQYLSALMAGALVFFGFQIVKHLSDHQQTAEIYYLLIAISCIPMYVYTSFVYGEIISISLLLLAAWMLLSCLKNFSWGKAAVFALSSGIAIQVRQNSLIIIIGFLIVLFVKLIAGNTKNAVSLLICIAAGILLPSFIITHGVYGGKIPDDSETMPAVLYIAMGLNWDKVNPGWYNGYNYIIFEENEYDVEASKEQAKEKIREFLQIAKDNDGYAVDFFVHKITNQWSAPMYHCLAMNTGIEGEQGRLAHSVFFGRLGVFLQKFMNIYQLLIYGSVLFVLLIKRKKWTHLENYVLLIGIFGGFLFSLMWESKTRYVFPYFMFMLPYAAVGLGNLKFKR